MGLFLCQDWLPLCCSWRMIGSRTAGYFVRTKPVICSRSGMIATRGPHMNRLRLAISATLLGVVLATGCASPCGGCGGGVFRRTSMFRSRRACPCPCECCSSCGGGVPIVGAGADFGDFGDGPMLEPPGAPMSSGPPPLGMGGPTMLPPSLGAPLGAPTVPGVDPGRLIPSPIPNAAQPMPIEGSSRRRSK
jgi:hypothetical protein